ncbi:MAG: MMPL family transporter [Candidatus Wallbacteria bacterium]|nr:MMPL family transporter [Candidatus Wallbacteria bacterium]
MRVYDRPRTLVVLGLALTAFAGWSAFPIRLGNDLESLLQGHPSYATYREFLSRLGTDESVVVFHPSGGLDPGSVRELFDLECALKRLPCVRRVSSLLDLVPEEARASREALTQWLGRAGTLTRLRETIARTRFARGHLASGDLEFFAAVVTLDLPAGGGPRAETVRREAFATLRRTLDGHYGARPRQLLGYLVVEERVLELVRKSNLVLMPLAILVGSAVLGVLFRRLALVAVALTSVLSALVWTAACFKLGDYTLNVFSTMLFPLLLTVGLTTTIYVMSAYLLHAAEVESADTVPSAQAALHVRVLREVVPPTLICTTTTFAGFLSLAWTDTPEIRKFGIYDALGTVLCLVSVLLFVPPLMSLLGLAGPRRRTTHVSDDPVTSLTSKECPGPPRRRHGDRLATLLVLVVRKVGARAGLVTVCFALILLLGAQGVRRLPVESASIRGLYDDDPVVLAKRDFERSFGPIVAVELLVRLPQSRPFLELDGFRTLPRLQSALERVPGVASTLSPADVLLDAASFVAKAPKQDIATDRELALLARLAGDGGRGDLLGSYLADDGRLARVRVPIAREGSLEILALAGELRRVALESLPPGSSVEVTGRNVLSAIVHRNTLSNELTSFALALAAILAVMALSFGSLGIAAIAAAPNLLPLLLTYGTMGWLGATLDVVTGTIPCILIGLVVDDTVHYFFRYRGHRARGTSAALAARLTTLHTGRAMVSSALVLAAGASVMAFSGFKMTMEFGVFTALAVLYGIAVELTLTPALLVLLPGLLGK